MVSKLTNRDEDSEAKSKGEKRGKKSKTIQAPLFVHVSSFGGDDDGHVRYR